ncbi:MAG: hypothetical protein EHM42_00840 [Planctomycetaceae bacterium]|nr:MAG: hypothetical protein EHM42_00840 [Planctomycetaceae bacterium]
MTVQSLAQLDRRSVRRLVFRVPPSLCDGFEARAKAELAGLSATAINQMTSNEPAPLICFADLPDLLCRKLNEHLPFYDRTVLMRRALLARRCCLNHRSESLGRNVE